MVHLNKISILIILIISILIISYFLLFPKQKDYYEIKSIDFELYFRKNNKIYSFKPDSDFIIDGFEFIGLSLKLKKNFISKSNSKRILFGGSMEKGIIGIDNLIKLNIVNLNNNVNITKNLSAEIPLNVDKNTIGYNEFFLYENHITLYKFIDDINSRKDYTKGISFNNRKIYFTFFNKSDPNLKKVTPKIFFK